MFLFQRLWESREEEGKLHHFSDASTKGYGQCSYFIVVKKVAVIHRGEVQ